MRVRRATLQGVLSNPIARLMISPRPIHLLSAPVETRSTGFLWQTAATRLSLYVRPSQKPSPSSARAMSQHDVSKFCDTSKSAPGPDASFNR